MTLDVTLLEKLGEWQPPGPGRQTFSWHDVATGTTVNLTVDRQDAMSCEAAELCVTRAASAMARENSLADWARRVADRVTGLLEPLHLLEVDEAQGQALLRSEKPVQRQEKRFYYEAILSRTGTATVRRYRGSMQTAPRQQVGFMLTHEAIAKLAGDLAADQ